jgi:pimeloyl-ACP methyl ester carboxylesterase
MDDYTPVPEAPEWFRRALATRRCHLEVRVDDSTVHAMAWGEPGSPGLVLVHGGGAHAHWWTHVAAVLAADFRVVAVDLSGHGDSGHRTAYSLEQWADEVLAVADAGQFAGPPVVIGHSMGGLVAIVTAARHPERLRGAIVCDSPVTDQDPEVTAPQLRRLSDQALTYSDLGEAVGRFRTIPPQDGLPYVMDHVARQSLRLVPGGWQWKLDRQIFTKFGGSLGRSAVPYLSRVRCRLAILRAEHGLVTPYVHDFMYNSLGRVTPVITLPETGHHMMLDQPLILLTAIRTLLGDWEHSNPRRRETAAGAGQAR